MRHRLYGKKLGRDGAGRKHLKLSLLRGLIQNGRIETTQAKARSSALIWKS
jgi:ribosomal protein L17